MMKSATKLVLAVLLVLALPAEAEAQNTLSLLWFRAGSGCPVSSTEIEISSGGPFTTMDDAVEGNSLGCLSDTQFDTDNWDTAASVDVTNGPYMSFRFTMVPGASSVTDGTDDQVKIWGIFRDADGPTTGQVYYSLDGAPYVAAGPSFTIGTSDSNPEIILPVLTISENESMDFRLYAWNAAAATGTVNFAHFDYISDAVLPVELTAFDALIDGTDVLLTWETASELNNAGFFVEMATHDQSLTTDDKAFHQLGFVEGNGTTEFPQSYQHRITALEPGRYTFRLKQIDYDGTFEYHPEVEALVEVPTTHFLSTAYPNPFNPQAQFRLSIAERQHVTVAVYNALGQAVAELHDGILEANVTRTFTIDGSLLQSGVYLYQVTGERFSESRTVMLVK